jgi:hypothetical protein
MMVGRWVLIAYLQKLVLVRHRPLTRTDSLDLILSDYVCVELTHINIFARQWMIGRSTPVFRRSRTTWSPAAPGPTLADSIERTLEGRIRHFLKIRLPTRAVERDRWLRCEEVDRLIRNCASHLAVLMRLALTTGCRASEITGLKWGRVDLDRKTAWLNKTKNGMPRGVPLNEDAMEMLIEQIGKNRMHCFTCEGAPIRWQISNTAWHTALAASGSATFIAMRSIWLARQPACRAIQGTG